MTQKYTILFDLDGTLVDTAPDLMNAHNHVMKKYGYPTKSTEEIRNLVGQGAGAMLGRSIWGQAKKEFGKIDDKKIKNNVFIGSNSSLVAPVTINENSIVGAGSVITKNIKKKSLALTRANQIEIKNYKRKKR